MSASEKIRKKARLLLAKVKQEESTRTTRALPVSVTQFEDEHEVVNPSGVKLKFGRFESADTRTAYIVIPGEVMDMGVEIKRLAESLGLRIIGSKHLNKGRKISGATFIGEGVAEQIHKELEGLDGALVIIDAHLTPGQIKNLENYLKIPVLDRRVLILAIF